MIPPQKRLPFLKSKMVGGADKATFKRASEASKVGQHPTPTAHPHPLSLRDIPLSVPRGGDKSCSLCDRNRCRSRNPRSRHGFCFFRANFSSENKKMHLPFFAVRAGIELKTTFLGAEFSHFCEGSAPFLKCLCLKGRNSKNATRSYQGVRLYRQALINGCVKFPIKNRTRFVRKQRKTIIIKY